VRGIGWALMCARCTPGPTLHAFAKCGGDFRKGELAAALESRDRTAGERIRGPHALQRGARAELPQRRADRALPGIEELHIGHAIVSRAIYVGLRDAVRQMKDLMLGAERRG
jgi:pyridoxine 5-phosphate synthase